MAQTVDTIGGDHERQAKRTDSSNGAALRRKQPPVVGREANGRVAFVDDFEKIDSGGRSSWWPMKPNRCPRPPYAARNIVPHPLAQAVVVVTRVVDGQQAHCPRRKARRAGGRGRSGQRRVLAIETPSRKAHGYLPEACPQETATKFAETHARIPCSERSLRNLFLIASPLGQRGFQKCGRCRRRAAGVKASRWNSR